MSKKIAFQGIEGANSYGVARLHYSDHQAFAYPNFEDLFVAVANGEADKAIVPLENSYAGRVGEVHQLLHNSDLYIVAEHFQPIEHVLAGIKGASFDSIEEIYSHPQALMQTRQNLSHFLPNAKRIASSNTAVAAFDVSRWKSLHKAAICSPTAAAIYDLQILQNNLEDASGNMTIFVVIAKEMEYLADAKNDILMTSLIFSIRNIPAALYKALGGFATNNVNMLKLESYIKGGCSEQAEFFISFAGHPEQKNVALALEELGFFSKQTKTLGIYQADAMRKL